MKMEAIDKAKTDCFVAIYIKRNMKERTKTTANEFIMNSEPL